MAPWRHEIQLLRELLADKANSDNRSVLGVPGDFNIKAYGDPAMAALESSGVGALSKLKVLPSTNVKRDAYYDQIAFWKPSRNRGYARLDVEGAGILDCFEHVYTLADEAEYRAESAAGLKTTSRYSDWRTYKMTDHLPMWVQLRTNSSAEYLEEMVED